MSRYKSQPGQGVNTVSANTSKRIRCRAKRSEESKHLMHVAADVAVAYRAWCARRGIPCEFEYNPAFGRGTKQ